MSETTRARLLATARSLFAERGFDGVSIAQIASALGVTKQALLHHFGSKEKLYGEVLHSISSEFEDVRAMLPDGGRSPVAILKAYLERMIPRDAQETERVRLLMRELLDNHRRAAEAKRWYLSDFLEHLIAMVRRVPGWEHASQAAALALAYQLLGAINYYAVSGPTLTAIFGAAEYGKLEAGFRSQTRYSDRSNARRRTAALGLT